MTAARGRRRRETRTSRCLTLHPWVISYRISAKSRYDQHKPSSIVSPRPHIVVAIIMSTEALAGEVACQQFQFIAMTAVIAVLVKHLQDVRDQNSSFSTGKKFFIFHFTASCSICRPSTRQEHLSGPPAVPEVPQSSLCQDNSWSRFHEKLPGINARIPEL